MSQSVDIVYKDQDKTRLDLFLTEKFASKGYTRSYWLKMIKAGHVLVNNGVKKSGYALAQEDKIEIDWPDIDMTYAGKISVIYEDEEVAVLNKPAGVLTHSKGRFNPEYTVADFVAPKFAGSKPAAENTRLGIIHRLDRQTSGVLITAKTNASSAFLTKQFATRDVQKFYLAVVEGLFQEESMSIDIPLMRDPQNPKAQKVDGQGKQAKTKLEVINNRKGENVAVVLLQPETGRTHQLRVHLAHIGHPIIGDTLYGSTTSVAVSSQRFLLHAYALRVKLPSETEKATYVAPIPEDMSSYISDDELSSINKRFNQE